jgi:hypothetical protein
MLELKAAQGPYESMQLHNDRRKIIPRGLMVFWNGRELVGNPQIGSTRLTESSIAYRDGTTDRGFDSEVSTSVVLSFVQRALSPFDMRS